MSRRPQLSILAGLCILAFLAGLLRLFLWRFDVGDVYPPYSSLRSDPLGTRAWYEALRSLPARSVTRFLEATLELPPGRHACLLLLGTRPSLAASASERANLDRFLTEGGRVVVAFAGSPGDGRAARPPEDNEPDPDNPAEREANREPTTPPAPPADPTAKPTPPPIRRAKVDAESLDTLRLTRHWDLALTRTTPARPPDGVRATLVATHEPLPVGLSWAGNLAFASPASPWTVVYRVGSRPVVLQRRFGQGTLVAVADSYGFSNEGLRNALQVGFLSWAIGPSTHIVFDETHLGIQDRLGVMALARRYRLQGFLAALAGLVGLWLWRNLSQPVVAAADPSPSAPRTALAASQALRDLLARHLRRDDVLDACVEAWSRTSELPAAQRHVRRQRLHARLAAERAKPQRQRHDTACYQDLCNILAQKDEP